MADPLHAPRQDELEVSLFGPGLGECVVVHLGSSDWLVVDSCTDEAGHPVAASYLQAMGVPPEDAIRHVVVTHWHDDHHRGAAALFERARSAEFACSIAANSKEFLHFLAAYQRARSQDKDASEFERLLREVIRRREGTRTQARGPRWLITNRPLYRRKATADMPDAEVIPLSPSDAIVTLAKADLSALIPTPGQPRRRAVALDANQLSVVLHVRVGEHNVLLGSDLEREDSNQAIGWRAIIEDTTRTNHKSGAYKVAHHGATSGDDPAIWTELLVKDPIAMVTPFRRGSLALPTMADRQRLLENSSQVLLTASPDRRPQPASRGNPIDKLTRHVARNRRLRQFPKVGHVRLRWAVDAVRPEISLFEGAYRL